VLIWTNVLQQHGSTRAVGGRVASVDVCTCPWPRAGRLVRFQDALQRMCCEQFCAVQLSTRRLLEWCCELTKGLLGPGVSLSMSEHAPRLAARKTAVALSGRVAEEVLSSPVHYMTSVFCADSSGLTRHGCPVLSLRVRVYV
jgi:hypothetical protein